MLPVALTCTRRKPCDRKTPNQETPTTSTSSTDHACALSANKAFVSVQVAWNRSEFLYRSRCAADVQTLCVKNTSGRPASLYRHKYWHPANCRIRCLDALNISRNASRSPFLKRILTILVIIEVYIPSCCPYRNAAYCQTFFDGSQAGNCG